MTTSTTGLITGLALGFAAAFGGFAELAIVVLFGAIGLAVGGALGGQLDISALTGDQRDRNR